MQDLRHKQPMANRREFLAGAAIFALATGLPVPALAAAPSPHIALLLKTVAQIVIPRSDTPGAGDVGVGAFLSLAFAHGMEGAQGYDLWLDKELNRRAGRDFLAQTPAQRVKIVTQLDADAFPPGPPPATPSPWVAIKALILTGYYTSEAGASKELQYNLIPGRWDADIPLKPGARAYSSDWTAVEFG